jgi:hypothetical protein
MLDVVVAAAVDRDLLARILVEGLAVISLNIDRHGWGCKARFGFQQCLEPNCKGKATVVETQ